MVIKKRQIITATLVIALGAAVFINWFYTKPDVESANNTPSAVQGSGVNLGDAQYVNSTSADSDVSKKDSAASSTSKDEYFAGTKLRRSAAHDEAAETLNKVIKDSSSNAQAVKEATAALTALSNAIKLEGDMESLIKAKIGSDCVVLINNSSAEIVVAKGVLDDSKLLQIKEIALKQTGFPVENITIVELNG